MAAGGTGWDLKPDLGVEAIRFTDIRKANWPLNVSVR
jgi:hypothetical protein